MRKTDVVIVTKSTLTSNKTLMHTLIGQITGQLSSILENKGMPKGLVPTSNVETG